MNEVEGVSDVDAKEVFKVAYVDVFVFISILYETETPDASLRGFGIAHETVTDLSLF